MQSHRAGGLADWAQPGSDTVAVLIRFSACELYSPLCSAACMAFITTACAFAIGPAIIAPEASL